MSNLSRLKAELIQFRQVFHELARHLQTRRLIAGDSMSLDQDKSFYCVVDGTVQVYAQTGESNEGRQGLWEDEDMNGYQLLNEVGSGGTLSSLFTILSLFTEDVKMSWQDDGSEVSSDDQIGTDDGISMPTRNRMRRANSDVSQFDLDTKLKGHVRRPSVSSTASTVHPSGYASPRDNPLSPDFHNEPSTPRFSSFIHLDKPDLSQNKHRGVVARASEDSTLAVIPAEAFRRLTKKFPKATGHIVQGQLSASASREAIPNFFCTVILTRFSRVTFNAAHNYLGLTSEVLRTEKAINDIACHPLPTSFYEGGGLQYLRQRFDGASSSASETESDYFSFTHSPKESSKKLNYGPPTTSKSKNTGAGALPSRSSSFQVQPSPSTPFRPPSSRQMVQAGDLHISTGTASEVYRPPGRTYSILNTPRNPRASDVADGKGTSQNRKAARLPTGDFDVREFDLREEVMSSIAKSIGLLQPPLSGTDSVENSPVMHPSDARPPTSAFSSPFGSLSLLDLGDDNSSMTGSSSILSSSGGYMSGLDNEVEILFFAAGSTLAKAGELNTGEMLHLFPRDIKLIQLGLFYVIEGFLDILLPVGQCPPHENTDPKPGLFDSEPWRAPGVKSNKPQQKFLFTVKPGGIAGYLGRRPINMTCILVFIYL